MYDLNRKRHRREKEVALKLAQQLITNITSATEAAPPEVLAHHFGLVCERMSFMPDDGSVKRILDYALKDINQRSREVDKLAKQLVRVTGR